MLTVLSTSTEMTELLGEVIGKVLHKGDVLLLRGDLGTGKTALARGIARGANCSVSARSPTFIIVAEYPGSPTIYHCDLYRIAEPDEVDDLGIHENLSHGALLVEWPENGQDALPQDAVTIEISTGITADDRKLSFSPNGSTARALLDRIIQDVSQDSELSLFSSATQSATATPSGIVTAR